MIPSGDHCFSIFKTKDIAAQKAPKTEKGKLVGAAIAAKAKDNWVSKPWCLTVVVIYHGRVKAVAEGAKGRRSAILIGCPDLRFICIIKTNLNR